MEKHMVQCEDGRRREARVHGVPREEEDFRIWKAGVRLMGKHVSGEAWYSHKTKTWYFIADPGGKHAHLMTKISDRLREESINKLQAQLKALEFRHTIEQKKIAEHRNIMTAIENEIEQVQKKIEKMKSGTPVEPSKPLEYSRYIRKG